MRILLLDAISSFATSAGGAEHQRSCKRQSSSSFFLAFALHSLAVASAAAAAAATRLRRSATILASLSRRSANISPLQEINCFQTPGRWVRTVQVAHREIVHLMHSTRLHAQRCQVPDPSRCFYSYQISEDLGGTMHTS